MKQEDFLTSKEVTHRMIVMNHMHRRMLEGNLEGTDRKSVV